MLADRIGGFLLLLQTHEEKWTYEQKLNKE